MPGFTEAKRTHRHHTQDPEHPLHCWGAGLGCRVLKAEPAGGGWARLSGLALERRLGKAGTSPARTALLVLRGHLPREACPDAPTLGFPKPCAC